MQHLRKDNHYVSQFYIKSWAAEPERVWTCRILVSNDNVPLWKLQTVNGIAYHRHLYTRIVDGKESDDIERWFDREFETPVNACLDKIEMGRKLTRMERKKLISFVAAQDVRTPVRYIESMKRWEKELPDMISETIQESIKELQEGKRTGEAKELPTKTPFGVNPFRVSLEPSPNPGFSRIKVNTLLGRNLWLSGIERLLTITLRVLFQHKWGVLEAANNMEWLTSDNPVIRLSYRNQKNYSLDGGWKVKNGEIFLPLSPRQLFYTKIGSGKLPHRKLSRTDTNKINKIIAENAYRLIFSTKPLDDIERLRPRIVDSDLFKAETKMWEEWHGVQKKAELDLIRGK